MYRIETTSEFDEDLGRLDRAIAQRIIRKVEWLAEYPESLRAPLRHLPDPDRRALALGLMASMVNFLAHGLVDASYFVIDLAFVFFMTLGLVQWMGSTFRFTRSETDELETGL